MDEIIGQIAEEVGKAIAREVGKELAKSAIKRTKDCLESFNESQEPSGIFVPRHEYHGPLPTRRPDSIIELKLY